jgi:hypothetical protein
MTQSPDIGRLRQSEIYLNGLAGERPHIPTNFQELEQRAKRKLSRVGCRSIAEITHEALVEI